MCKRILTFADITRVNESYYPEIQNPMNGRKANIILKPHYFPAKYDWINQMARLHSQTPEYTERVEEQKADLERDARIRAIILAKDSHFYDAPQPLAQQKTEMDSIRKRPRKRFKDF